jgi:hypothetical protein
VPALDPLQAAALAQIAAIDRHYKLLAATARHITHGGGALPDEYAEFNATCVALIDRVTGRHDSYYEHALHEIELHGSLTSAELAPSLYGIVRSLKRDLDHGWLTTFREREHATLLHDFLTLAEHAANAGRTGPATALIGAVLETHLRHLAAKNQVALTTPATETGARDQPRPPQDLNNDLAQVAYDTPERQTVTAWLGLLANAGQSRARTLATIRDLRTFIARHPA